MQNIQRNEEYLKLIGLGDSVFKKTKQHTRVSVTHRSVSVTEIRKSHRCVTKVDYNENADMDNSSMRCVKSHAPVQKRRKQFIRAHMHMSSREFTAADADGDRSADVVEKSWSTPDSSCFPEFVGSIEPYLNVSSFNGRSFKVPCPICNRNYSLRRDNVTLQKHECGSVRIY